MKVKAIHFTNTIQGLPVYEMQDGKHKSILRCPIQKTVPGIKTEVSIMTWATRDECLAGATEVGYIHSVNTIFDNVENEIYGKIQFKGKLKLL